MNYDYCDCFMGYDIFGHTRMLFKSTFIYGIITPR